MAKSPAKKEEAPQAEAKPATGKRKKLIIAALALVVLLVAAGAAAVLLLGRHAEEGAGEDATAETEQEAPVFVNLEAFTVNLQHEDGERFLQAVVTLKLTDASVGDHIKTYMPELRHRMLLLLSSKHASEISTPDGRELLAEELRGVANGVLYPATGKRPKPVAGVKPIGNAQAARPKGPSPDDPIQGVLFTSFIVQ